MSERAQMLVQFTRTWGLVNALGMPALATLCAYKAWWLDAGIFAYGAVYSMWLYGSLRRS